MKKLFSSVLLAGMVSQGLLVTGHAAEFSADMVSNMSGQTTSAKIMVKDKKSRMEMPGLTMINRMDLGLAWMLMPDQNMYMEHPIDPNTIRSLSTEGSGETSRTSLGKETIDGKPAEKFRITYNTGGQTETLLQWIGPGNIPLKTAAEDNSWSTEFRNIQTSGVDDSQFEIPKGYQKFAMPAMPQGVQ